MFAFSVFYQSSATVFFAVFTYPNLPPDPVLVAQLAQARGAVHGENGYAALFELPMDAVKNWTEEVPRCNDDTVDCLALAWKSKSNGGSRAIPSTACAGTTTSVHSPANMAAIVGRLSAPCYRKIPCTPTALPPVSGTWRCKVSAAMPVSD